MVFISSVCRFVCSFVSICSFDCIQSIYVSHVENHSPSGAVDLVVVVVLVELKNKNANLPTHTFTFCVSQFHHSQKSGELKFDFGLFCIITVFLALLDKGLHRLSNLFEGGSLLFVCESARARERANERRALQACFYCLLLCHAFANGFLIGLYSFFCCCFCC